MADQEPKAGRPPKPMPEPIDGAPENVAWTILNTPPKRGDQWKFLKEGK